MTPVNHAIVACDKRPGGSNPANKPDRVIRVVIGPDFNFKNVTRDITERKANPNGDNENDPDETGVNTPNPGIPGGTRLDSDLRLEANHNNKRQTILLKFVITDPAITFRTDGLALAAGDKNGRKIFCNLDVDTVDYKKAKVLAVYLNRPGDNSLQYPKTIASLNIGLMIKQPDNTLLPVFVDPIIKNDG